MKNASAPTFAIVALATNAVLVGVVFWATGPGVGSFNAFNESVFGKYYTAGAIAMIALYGLAFLAVVSLAVVATAVAWIRRETPRWAAWAATAASVLAPVVSVNLLRSA